MLISGSGKGGTQYHKPPNASLFWVLLIKTSLNSILNWDAWGLVEENILIEKWVKDNGNFSLGARNKVARARTACGNFCHFASSRFRD